MTLSEMIKSFQSLSDEEQDSLLKILCQYRAKVRETAILANFNQLKQSIAHGTAKKGTVEDLINDLNEH